MLSSLIATVVLGGLSVGLRAVETVTETTKKHVGLLIVDGALCAWVGTRDPRKSIGFTVGPFFATLDINNDPVAQVTVYDPHYTSDFDWSWGLAAMELGDEAGYDELSNREPLLRRRTDAEVECVDCGCALIGLAPGQKEPRCDTDQAHFEGSCGDDCPRTDHQAAANG